MAFAFQSVVCLTLLIAVPWACSPARSPRSEALPAGPPGAEPFTVAASSSPHGPMLSVDYVRLVAEVEEAERRLLDRVSVLLADYQRTRELDPALAEPLASLVEEFQQLDARLVQVEPPGTFWRFARLKARYYATLAEALDDVATGAELRNRRLVSLGLDRLGAAHRINLEAQLEFRSTRAELGG